MSMAPEGTPTHADGRLSERLAGVYVGVRADLRITRQLFGGKPGYVVQDPITLAATRLDPSEYRVMCHIQRERSLGQTFEQLCAEGELDRDDAEHFYQFVVSLHQHGVLQLPISDEARIARQRSARRQAAAMQAWLSPISFRLPLGDPDKFLERTRAWFEPLFSGWVFVCWIALMLSATWVGIMRWSDLSEPLGGVLASQNLGVLWITLIVLKVIHEAGHAYACKCFGGRVPETGVFFIVLTPCAYVDATASWGFPRMRDRLIVSLAGMYFELAVAGIAMFVWALTAPGLVNSIAFNVIFLASLTTLAFNANPLMRFDGYYILSDLVGVPNLRARAMGALAFVGKRLALGLQPAAPTKTRSALIALAVFGVSAVIYKTLLVLGIATLVASKMLIVGLILGATYVLITFGGGLLSVGRYLLVGDETRSVRPRAIAVATGLGVVLPLAIAFLPVSLDQTAPAVARAETEHFVRATIDGTLTPERLSTGSSTEAGSVVAQLTNLELVTERNAQAAELAALEVEYQAALVNDPAAARALSLDLASKRDLLLQADAAVAQLGVRSEVAGKVVRAVDAPKTGAFVRRGQPIARVLSGETEIRFLLTEESFWRSSPKVGQVIEFRSASRPQHTISARIEQLEATANRQILETELTSLARGEIAVDPLTGEAQQPFIRVVAKVLDEDLAPVHGERGMVALSMRPESLGAKLKRAALRLLDDLRAA